jgi:hypothetical protein
MPEAAAATQTAAAPAERSSARPAEREGDDLGTSVTRLHSLVGNGAVGRLLRGPSNVDARLAVVRAELARTGEPLDGALRDDAERELGAELPEVRIHRASSAPAAVNATAFTVGGHVVLGPDVASLESSQGRRVLLHELVHVLQQQRSATPSLGLTPPGAPAERAAAAAETSRAAGVGPASRAGLARLVREKDLTRLNDDELRAEYDLVTRELATQESGPDREAAESYLADIEQAVRNRQSPEASGTGQQQSPPPTTTQQSSAEAPPPGLTYNTALSLHQWAEAARALADMNPADRQASLRALDWQTRAHLRDAAASLDRSPDNPLVAEIESLEQPADTSKTTAAAPPTQETDNSEIPDARGMGYNELWKNAGLDSKKAVRALASVELPVSKYFPLSEKPLIPDIEAWKKLDEPTRKSILALEPSASGTALAGWFDVLRANDPGPKPPLTPDQEREALAAYYGSTRDETLVRREEAAKKELPTVGYMDVDAKWKENKYGLITAAQAPNHGIKADTLHQIWTHYWSDRYALAREWADTTERRLWTVQADAENPVLEADLKKAKSVEALADVMFANSNSALEILRFADAQGKSLTLDELNARVVDHAQFMEGMQLLMLALSMGGGPPGVKGGKARVDPVKVEVDPVKVEADPVKVEADPVKVEGEPVKVDPVKAEPVKVEPVKVEPVKVEPVKVEPVTPAPAVKVKPVDMSSIGAPTEPPQLLDSADFSKVKLEPGQDALYILRDSEGNVLKVGKTSEAGAKGRFAVYKRAGALTGKQLTLEVHPLKPSGRNAEFYEGALRTKMEGEGHKLPWDNTGGRLGRPGFGTPGEGVRTPPVSKERMTELLELHKGNLREVGKDLGVHRRTADLWAKAYGLRPQDFREKGP